MTKPIKWVIGLGNPGERYDATRHNAGAWLVDSLAESSKGFSPHKKFKALVSDVRLRDEKVMLAKPMCYMNESGRVVRAIMDYYNVARDEILIAHDELDLSPGTARFKLDGGHGGHNGLRDIIACTGGRDFWRLRLGIGHPGHRDEVHDYVLSRPSKADKQHIERAIDEATCALPIMVSGRVDEAMKLLHT